MIHETTLVEQNKIHSLIFNNIRGTFRRELRVFFPGQLNLVKMFHAKSHDNQISLATTKALMGFYIIYRIHHLETLLDD